MDSENTENSPAHCLACSLCFVLILNSVYFTFLHIFTFQYAAHFCPDGVQLHCSSSQDVAVRDCANQHTGKHYS